MCHRSKPGRPVAFLAPTTFLSSNSKIWRLSSGVWKIHCNPASTGGSSSRLQSGSETLSIAVLPKVSWTSNRLRMSRRLAWERHLASESLGRRLPFLEVFQQGNHQRCQTSNLSREGNTVALRTQE